MNNLPDEMILKVCDYLNFHSLLQLILTSQRFKNVISDDRVFHHKRIQQLSIFGKYLKKHTIDVYTASKKLADLNTKNASELLTFITNTELGFLFLVSTPFLLARSLRVLPENVNVALICRVQQYSETYPDLLTNPVYQHYLRETDGISTALSFAMHCRITARILLQTDDLWKQVHELSLTDHCLSVVAFTRKHQCAIDLLTAINNPNYSETHAAIMAAVRTDLLEKLNPSNEAPYNPFLGSGIRLSV